MSQATAFTVPLLPGTTEIDRREMLACWRGERRADHEASRQRLGITAEQVWLQSTPGGDVAVVRLETADLARAFEGMATSDDPFDRWFREHVLDVHGLDVTQPMEPTEQILDYRTD